MSLRNRLPWLAPVLLVFAACQIPGAAVALDDFHVATSREGTEVDVLANDYVTGSDPTIEVVSGPSCGDLISSTSSVVVTGMQQCEGVINLSYRVVDEFGSSGEANVEISLPGPDDTTTTIDQGRADLVPNRQLVEFGEVESETTGRQTVTFENVGTAAAEVFDLITTPDTEFDVENTDCVGVIEPGADCFVDLLFTPFGELPDDPAVRSTPEEHRGVLELLDDQDRILAELELTGASIFLLPDLTIDVLDFGLPGRAESGVAIPVALQMRNLGRADAGEFVVTIEYQDLDTGQWTSALIIDAGPAGLRVEPGLQEIIVSGFPAGTEEDLTVLVELVADFDPGSAIPIRAIADSCAAEEAGPDCLVVESDESNNLSDVIDVNPVFGHSEVPLDGRLSEEDEFERRVGVGEGETNLANLVTDALFWAAVVRSEELGLEGPRLSLLSSQTMLTGVVPPGDLRPLHLIDVWDSEIVVTDPIDTAVLKNALELGVAAGDARVIRFPHLGNGSYDWCISGADDGNRVFNVEVGGTQVVEGGRVLDEETYPITTLDPLTAGGPYRLEGLGYSGIGMTLRRAVIEYVQVELQGLITADQNEGAYQPGGNGRTEEILCGVG